MPAVAIVPEKGFYQSYWKPMRAGATNGRYNPACFPEINSRIGMPLDPALTVGQVHAPRAQGTGDDPRRFGVSVRAVELSVPEARHQILGSSR